MQECGSDNNCELWKFIICKVLLVIAIWKGPTENFFYFFLLFSSYLKEFMVQLQIFISSDYLFLKNWFDNN